MQCQVEKCDREAKGRGYCLMHYKRFRKHGDANFIFEYSHRRNKECKISSCNKIVHAKGFCISHYHSNRKYGDALYVDKRRKDVIDRTIASGGERRIRKCGRSEHRFIVENYIGRKLEDREVVHHIDLNPYNNEISNLYVYESKSEHTKVHCELRRIAKEAKTTDKELVRNGIVHFKNGKYILR